MVPSDPIPSLARRRYTRPRTMRDGSRRAFRLKAPLRPFTDPPDQSFPTRRSVCSNVGPETYKRPFPRPQRANPFEPTHSGVNGPGLPLRFPTGCFHGPFGFRLHHPGRFAPPRTASLPETRCRSHNRCDRLPFQSPLPFGTFTSLQIRAFDWLATCRPAFRFRPISSRSPQPVFYH